MRGSAVFRTGVAPGGALAGPWVKNELWTRARAVPSLDLCFADNKSLVDATTGSNLVTFTRASSGTFVGSDGVLQTAATDAPRFDHNPTTGESLGLLVEEQRTNLLLRSEQFDDANWTKTSLTVTVNSDVSPDGQTTADTLTIGGPGQSIYQSATVTASTSYTGSVYVKLGTLAAANYKVSVYDNTNAAFIAVDVVPTQTPTSTGWTRISYTFTTPATCTSVRWYTFRNSANVSGTAFVWGAQLEAGAFPTSYIPTTTAAATRSADVCSITGSAFSGWYDASTGSVYSDWSTASSGEQQVWTISDETLNESLRVSTLVAAVSNNTRLVAIDGNSLQAGLAVGVYTPGSRRKTMFTYQQNNFIGVADGGTVVTDTSGTLPTVNKLSIGSNWSTSGSFLGGHIRRLCYWPQALTGSTSQGITQ